MSADDVRSFVAVELPEDARFRVRAVIERLRDLVASPDIKWVASANIHLTLKFLGQVPSDRLEEVQRRLTPACVATPYLRFEVHTLGGFPSVESPRVIWAGLSGDIDPVSELARRIDTTLAELGFSRENRPFTPHLTLARVRQEASGRTRSAIGTAIKQCNHVTGIEFEANGISLMRSQLTPRGAVYDRMALIPFTPSSRRD